MQIPLWGPVFDSATVVFELADQPFDCFADLPAHWMVRPAVHPGDLVVRQGCLGGGVPLDAGDIAVNSREGRQ